MAQTTQGRAVIGNRQAGNRTSKYSPMNGGSNYLYTKGKQFTTLAGEEYIGEYHLLRDGTPITGPIEKVGSGERLLPYYANKDHYIYDKQFLFYPKPKTFVQPVPYLYIPRESEGAYTNGFDFRYFVQRHNSDSYAIEINADQYNRIGKTEGIDESIYAYAAVKWRLTGTLEFIDATNRANVNVAAQKLPALPYAISNYVQFARPTLQTAANNDDFYTIDRKLRGKKGIPLKQTYDRTTGRILPVT